MANGLPLAFNSALYPLANLQIQTATNALGSAVVAGTSASMNLENIVAVLGGSAFASGATAFVGQNIGAGKPDRVKKSILYCLGIGVGLSLIFGVLVYTFSEPLASLYVGSDRAAILAAQTRMKYVLLPYAICVAFGVINHVIQAFGYASFTASVNIICVLVFRVIWMTLVYPMWSTYECICQCYLVSWLLTLFTG